MTFIEFVYMFTATVIVIGQWQQGKQSRFLSSLQLDRQVRATELMLAHIKVQDKAVAFLIKQVRELQK